MPRDCFRDINSSMRVNVGEKIIIGLNLIKKLESTRFFPNSWRCPISSGSHFFKIGALILIGQLEERAHTHTRPSAHVCARCTRVRAQARKHTKASATSLLTAAAAPCRLPSYARACTRTSARSRVVRAHAFSYCNASYPHRHTNRTHTRVQRL